MGYYHHEYTGIRAVGIRFYRDYSHKSEYNLSKYGEMEKKAGTAPQSRENEVSVMK